MCVCQPGEPKLKAVEILLVWERDDPLTLWLTAVFVPEHPYKTFGSLIAEWEYISWEYIQFQWDCAG